VIVALSEAMQHLTYPQITLECYNQRHVVELERTTVYTTLSNSVGKNGRAPVPYHAASNFSRHRNELGGSFHDYEEAIR